MHRNKAMPERGAYNDGDPEEYGRVLDSFDNFDRAEQPQVRPRRSLLEVARNFTSTGRGSALPVISPFGTDKMSSSSIARSSDHSERSATVASASSTSDSGDVGVDSSLGESMGSGWTVESRSRDSDRRRNKVFDHEGQEPHCRDQESSDVHELNRKINSLKSKRRDEKAKLLLMEKSVEAHRAEIEVLQVELSKSLDTIDKQRKVRAADKALISKLNKQLKDAQLLSRTTREARLELQLRERNEELEATLQLLESKVERIVKLEAELQYAHGQRGESRTKSPSGIRHHGFIGSDMKSFTELQESQANCRQMERQNTMLKLLVEEIEECWKQGDEEDLESVFQKLPNLCNDIEPGEGSPSSFHKEIESFNLEGG